MSTSFIYRYGTVYELLMRGLYGRHYGARYRAIAALVPENAAVLDLCCGPATLYTRYLRQKSVRYTGLDLNERFIARLIRAGGSGQVWNLRADTPLPAADYVIMQGSLFHFLPDPEPVLDRMLDAARERVIVAEPVRNLTATRHRAMAGLGGRLTDAGDGARPLRFDEETLDELFRGFPEHVEERRLIAGGREKLYLLKP